MIVRCCLKKRVIRSFASRTLAAVVGAAVMFHCYGPTVATASEAPVYISELYISYGNDDASAKK